MSHWNDGRLMAYVDGELSPASRALADEHLGICAHCRGSFSKLAAERELLQEIFATAELPPASTRVPEALRARAGRLGQ